MSSKLGQEPCLKRLSKLTELAVLHVSKFAAYFEGLIELQGLSPRLNRGLGQLSSLKGLRELDVTDTIQHVGAEDVAWMRRNWRRLHWITGKLNEHGDYRKQPLSEDE